MEMMKKDDEEDKLDQPEPRQPQSQQAFLSLQAELEDDAKWYRVANRYDTKRRNKLPTTLENKDCRDIVAAAVDGSALANAFIHAGIRGDLGLLQILLDNRISIDIRDQNRNTTLIRSASCSSDAATRWLLHHNASVNCRNDMGETALIAACAGWYGNQAIPIVELLLETNADVDIQDVGGQTALMHACDKCYDDIVRVLLHRGADATLENKDGKTAFDLAVKEEIKDMLTNHVHTGYLLK